MTNLEPAADFGESLTGDYVPREVPLNPAFKSNPLNPFNMEVTITTRNSNEAATAAEAFITARLGGDWETIKGDVLRVSAEDYLYQGPQDFIANLQTVNPKVILFEDYIDRPEMVPVLRQIIKEYASRVGSSPMVIFNELATETPRSVEPDIS